MPADAERGEHAYAHPLDGDGYVCAFSFNADGRVHFRSRFVRTRCVPSCIGADACVLCMAVAGAR